MDVPLEDGKPRVVSHLQQYPSSVIKDRFHLSSITGKPAGTVWHSERPSSLEVEFHHQSPLLFTRVIKMPRAAEEDGGGADLMADKEIQFGRRLGKSWLRLIQRCLPYHFLFLQLGGIGKFTIRKSRLSESKLNLSKHWNCFLNHKISCAGSVKTKQQLWRQFPQGPFHKWGNMGKSSEYAAHNHHRRTLPLTMALLHDGQLVAQLNCFTFGYLFL